MEKYLKVCQKLRYMPREGENVQSAIFAVHIFFLQYTYFFAVQIIFLWSTVQIFCCVGKKNFERAVQSLPPYGGFKDVCTNFTTINLSIHKPIRRPQNAGNSLRFHSSTISDKASKVCNLHKIIFFYVLYILTAD